MNFIQGTAIAPQGGCICSVAGSPHQSVWASGSGSCFFTCPPGNIASFHANASMASATSAPIFPIG